MLSLGHNFINQLDTSANGSIGILSDVMLCPQGLHCSCMSSDSLIAIDPLALMSNLHMYMYMYV